MAAKCSFRAAGADDMGRNDIIATWAASALIAMLYAILIAPVIHQ